ncbi:hypothetical protein [Pseudogemmobacter faecipullorum]|uniref:Uncharacterized protein n=1 Tax=Pseudogemmobacter faecipullorum TaxID=2755041 RepID=A0ABS8CQ66_9RHOB|nr:hypothetical protein [Pseudogemmobacter faecipullorum]MCB5411503.1 hypothetical protein [Pseudogemmobacter faecipullorum]
MANLPKPPRERTARALCAHHGLPPDVTFEGRAMWLSYLPQVDAVLRTALRDEDWAVMVEAELG